MLQRSIQRMYHEIVLYDGDFGDPIASFVDFEPLTVLLEGEAEASSRCGAAVGLLVNFAVALDNSDSGAALESSAYRELEFALQRGLLAEFPSIEAAAKSARDGEHVFNGALRAVYLDCVRTAA